MFLAQSNALLTVSVTLSKRTGGIFSVENLTPGLDSSSSDLIVLKCMVLLHLSLLEWC